MHRIVSAVREYRRSARDFREGPRAPSKALFVTCGESDAATRLLSACEPLAMHQSPGGSVLGEGNRPDPAVAEAIALAARKGARAIVLAGHAGCHARGAPDDAATKDRLVREANALRELEGSPGEVHVLWFEEEEGDVYRYLAAERRFELMSDEQLYAFFGALIA